MTTTYGYINLSIADIFKPIKADAQNPAEVTSEEETISYEYRGLKTNEIYVVIQAYNHEILSARYTIERMFNRDPTRKFSKMITTYNDLFEYSTIYVFNSDYKCLFDSYDTFDSFCEIVSRCLKTLSINHIRLPFRFAFNVGPLPVAYYPKREDPTLALHNLTGIQLAMYPHDSIKDKPFEILNVVDVKKTRLVMLSTEMSDS